MTRPALTQEQERTDGRDIDPSRGALSGEGAQIRVEAPDHAYPTIREIERRIPSARADDEERTYYGQPVIKAPVWIWSVPLYLFVGGASGATSALAAAAQALDPKRLRRLIRRAHQVSMIGEIVSSGLLIYDLGRPARFLYMLRIFRPTSPMSIGAWLLSASGAASTLAVLAGERRAGVVAGYAAGVLGLPLAGYTAVLLTNTAVPLWQGGRRALPPLFLASSAASAGAVLSMLPTGRRGRAVARRFAMFGDLATLALAALFEREAGSTRRVTRPLHRGASGALWATARALTAASVIVSLATRGRRRVPSGALALAGALALRAAVFVAGKASARDPRATFRQQRARLAAA